MFPGASATSANARLLARSRRLRAGHGGGSAKGGGVGAGVGGAALLPRSPSVKVRLRIPPREPISPSAVSPAVSADGGGGGGDAPRADAADGSPVNEPPSDAAVVQVHSDGLRAPNPALIGAPRLWQYGKTCAAVSTSSWESASSADVREHLTHCHQCNHAYRQ